MESSRRTLLRAGLVVGATGATAANAADARPTAAVVIPRANPFTLGVASGDPLPDGFVIWTRLAVRPLAADGRGGMPLSIYTLAWQVATDELFTQVVRSGTVLARPRDAHSVHVEVGGLQPGREYWYRFRLGRHFSRVGRAVTAPALGSSPASLTMGFVSCQRYPSGYHTAYRHLAAERPDLILHLGDYIYEGEGDGIGRNHIGPETVTLANYRQRYAQYKTDPDLQAAHAAAPWLVVWDDHEVCNDYAADTPQNLSEQPTFLARRAAAYRAYYENMPLRRASVPSGPDLQLFRRIAWGDLATFHMLDTRQYRADQACRDCVDVLADPARSLPGMAQEQWLLDGFAASTARWDLLGQQVFYGRRDFDSTEAERVSHDAWDGYPASRQRITQGWVDAGVRNPVVLTGDVHAHWASDIYLDWQSMDTIVGAELIGTSIASGGDGYDEATGMHPWAAWNPNLRFWTGLRGYVSTTITPTELTARYMCVPFIKAPDAPVFTRATFVVEDGVRGLVQTQDNPLTGIARQAPVSDAQKIADTIALETDPE